MSKHSKSVITSIIIVLLLFAFTKYVLPSLQSNAPLSAQTHQITSPTVTPEAQGAQCHMVGSLPDSTCTPGAADPRVTQENINQTICVSGYTKTVRPSVGYTDNLKKGQMQVYGFSDSIKTHEEDHLISLELGGSPADPKNLWPEPGSSPNPKDKVENFLHDEVCSGKIQLQDAQGRIVKDWTTAEQGL